MNECPNATTHAITKEEEEGAGDKRRPEPKAAKLK